VGGKRPSSAPPNVRVIQTVDPMKFLAVRLLYITVQRSESRLQKGEGSIAMLGIVKPSSEASGCDSGPACASPNCQSPGSPGPVGRDFSPNFQRLHS
jgi:hypothetical protein